MICYTPLLSILIDPLQYKANQKIKNTVLSLPRNHLFSNKFTNICFASNIVGVFKRF